MNKYIENPKTKGSGILCAIPQMGMCPNRCDDCFFQGGRSYLEPLEEHLPNMPPSELAQNHIIRVNDGNDSNVNRDLVIQSTRQYIMKFYNTAIYNGIGKFDAPVVVTINMGKNTDKDCVCLSPIPPNLMFVRVRTNTWNIPVVDKAVDYYSLNEIPIILTFMAYFTLPIPESHKKDYIFRKRTLNSYWAITTKAWEGIMNRYKYNKWVYSCGKIEGEKGTTLCRFCGNCIREYFATIERMKRG